MAWETNFVFAVVAAAAVLFASGRLRFDAVALLVVLALAVSGVLTVREALAGFGDPVVVQVAAILVIGEMLRRTGVAAAVGNWLTARGGSSERRIMALLMLVSAGLGSVMNSTAVVAILVPVVQGIAAKTRLNATRLLLPMAFGSLISGMMTLIATTPNLVVSAELEAAGYDAFNFFSFTPIGLAVLAVAVLYMLLVGRRLLPGAPTVEPRPAGQGMREMMAEFGVPGRLRRALVESGSSLAGVPLGHSGLGTDHDLHVLLVERAGLMGRQLAVTPGPEFELRPGDVLVFYDRSDGFATAAADLGLARQVISDRQRQDWLRELGLASVLVHPESQLLGRTIRSAGFRGRFGLQVLAVRRKGERVEGFEDSRLRVGDALLVTGAWRRIARLRTDVEDLVLFATPTEIQDAAPEVRRLPRALLILAAMVAVIVLGILPVAPAVLLAALAAVAARTLSMEEGYRAIRWSSLVLIAGMLPVAAALDKTGGTDLIVGALVDALGGAGPIVMLAVFYFLTAGLSLLLSNSATAVLVAPIAVQAAQALGTSPQAFAMTVAIAASAGFASPVASPVCTLVVEPGGYRFVDFLRVGAPLMVLVGVVTVLVTPLLFPL
ncbi:MAG: SLC13 family permease [Krumholzibacteria bacterium]|nr:SLC13 family permease [Candidatus Krumholzibacteria bacterium]